MVNYLDHLGRFSSLRDLLDFGTFEDPHHNVHSVAKMNHMKTGSSFRRWMSTSCESMSQLIRRAAKVNTAENSGAILEKLSRGYARSPRAIQATIDLLHRIPPRFAKPYVTSDHLHLVFQNWQQAFLRGKDAVLSEDVVTFKLKRWAKTYGPDFIVETPTDRKIKRTPPLQRGSVGAGRLTDDSSDYEYYKVIRWWAESMDPNACVEIGRLVGDMKDQGVALSILLGVIQDRGAMLAIPTVDAIGSLLENGYDRILVRTAINAGRGILNRCHEPEAFRVARDVLDAFKRYKASTPEAVHLSFDLMDVLVRESLVADWFGSNQHYHSGLFNNYRRASLHHRVLGPRIVAKRVKEWSLTGKFVYSKTTIKLLLDVVHTQHEKRDAPIYMEEIIALLSDASTKLHNIHSPAYRTLLKAWVDSGRQEASHKVKEIIESAGDLLDVGVYNVAFKFWNKDVERIEWAMLVMRQRGVAMNSFSWLQILHCFVSTRNFEKAERALLRLNDTIENFHDEQNLASGLLALLRAYLEEARAREDNGDLLDKCNHLYNEIVLNSKIDPKIEARIEVVMASIHNLCSTSVHTGTIGFKNSDPPLENDIFPLYADEEDCEHHNDNVT